MSRGHSEKHSAKVEKTRANFIKVTDEAGGPTAAAFRLGVSLSTVNMIRSGERDPGLEVAYRIKECFAIAMEDWIDPQHTETVKRFA